MPDRDCAINFDGAAARRIRLAAGWTLLDVADAMGTDCSTLSLWERGRRRPRLPYARALAFCLRVDDAALSTDGNPLACDRPEVKPQPARQKLTALLNGPS